MNLLSNVCVPLTVQFSFRPATFATCVFLFEMSATDLIDNTNQQYLAILNRWKCCRILSSRQPGNSPWMHALEAATHGYMHGFPYMGQPASHRTALRSVELAADATADPPGAFSRSAGEQKYPVSP